jgi:hypothetical protein
MSHTIFNESSSLWFKYNFFICIMKRVKFMCQKTSVFCSLAITIVYVFHIYHQLTISLWQSLRRSLSSFVLPSPAPDPFPFIMDTKRAQLIDSSSKTDRSIFSVFGSSSSLRECTSDRPSSWGQCMVLRQNLVSTEQVLLMCFWLQKNSTSCTRSDPSTVPAKVLTFCYTI